MQAECYLLCMNTVYPDSNFGDLLRSWRSERRLSQVDLANTIETPSRHISFLETGRSKPSRNMIARLATALHVPLRERNVLLKAAGFADVYPSHDFSDEEMERLHQAVTRLMNAHNPFPSFIVDNRWNVLDANGSGRDLLSIVKDKFPFDPEHKPFNMIDAVFSPEGFRGMIDNWEDYARQYIQRLHREASSDKELRAVLSRVQYYSDLPKDWWAFDVKYSAQPMFPLEMRVKGQKLSFYTVVAAIALPTNALAQELRVETMFPADAITQESYPAN